MSKGCWIGFHFWSGWYSIGNNIKQRKCTICGHVEVKKIIKYFVFRS